MLNVFHFSTCYLNLANSFSAALSTPPPFQAKNHKNPLYKLSTVITIGANKLPAGTSSAVRIVKTNYLCILFEIVDGSTMVSGLSYSTSIIVETFVDKSSSSALISPSNQKIVERGKCEYHLTLFLNICYLFCRIFLQKRGLLMKNCGWFIGSLLLGAA